MRGVAASDTDQVGSATPGSIRESRVWSWRWPIGVADVADHLATPTRTRTTQAALNTRERSQPIDRLLRPGALCCPSQYWCLGSVTVVKIVNKRVAEISSDPGEQGCGAPPASRQLDSCSTCGAAQSRCRRASNPSTWDRSGVDTAGSQARREDRVPCLRLRPRTSEPTGQTRRDNQVSECRRLGVPTQCD